MDTATLLGALRRDGALLAATPLADVGRTVPGCPGWDVGQLLGHTGWVYRWATATLLTDPADPPHPRSIEKAPGGDAVVGWFGESLSALDDALERADLDRTFKTFIGPRPGRWWARRVAHETSIHRWDAQSATGEPDPIEPALAVDGIDEALDTYVSRRFDVESFAATGETLHLHATDVEGEWMLTMNPDGVVVATGHGKGDAAVRGTAADLLLFVMSRRDPADLEVFGDLDLPRRWQSAANF
jgi:uncharacterized protein (TIGR03083 family)